MKTYLVEYIEIFMLDTYTRYVRILAGSIEEARLIVNQMRSCYEINSVIEIKEKEK